MPIRFRLSILALLILSAPALAQTSQSKTSGLTAAQIVQRSIDSSGGPSVLQSMQAMEGMFRVVTAEHDTISVAVKRNGGSQYYISVLSASHESTVTVFSHGRAAEIKREQARAITDPQVLEDLQLRCFTLFDVGYQTLGYKLERLEDQKFQNFDTYVVKATSPLGHSRRNFYDKATGRMIMMIAESGQKTLFTEHTRRHGINYPAHLMMVSDGKLVATDEVVDLDFPSTLDTNWFHVPPQGSYAAPASIQTGLFRYVSATGEDSRMERTTTRQFELGNGSERYERTIEWAGHNLYFLKKLDSDPSPGTRGILVLVAQSIGRRHYCHYLSTENIGGTMVVEKME